MRINGFEIMTLSPHNPKVYRIRKSIIRTTMLKLNIYY